MKCYGIRASIRGEGLSVLALSLDLIAEQQVYKIHQMFSLARAR